MPCAHRGETLEGPSPFPLKEFSEDEGEEETDLKSVEETNEGGSDGQSSKGRRPLVQNSVVASTRQERELQRCRMNGGIDVASITRNVSQDYRSRNKHWRGGL